MSPRSSAPDYLTVRVPLADGGGGGEETEGRLYPVPSALAAALLVGGVGGGFDTPARDLYPRLAERLGRAGIATLRVRYRRPTDLDEAARDVLGGIELVRRRGMRRVGLVGHSLGGAVVVRAALASPAVATVVLLASQSYGAEDIGQLAPRPVLLLHGMNDTVLPAECSLHLYRRAREPKQLEVLPGTGHGLDEAAERVYHLTASWLLRHLGAPEAELRP